MNDDEVERKETDTTQNQETVKKGMYQKVSEMPKDELVYVVNLSAALVLVIVGAYQIITFAWLGQLASFFQFFTFLTPLFLIAIGVMLLIATQRPKMLSNNLAFLNTYMGMGCFNFFLSSIVGQALGGGHSDSIISFVWGCVFIAIGVFYIVRHFQGYKIIKKPEVN